MNLSAFHSIGLWLAVRMMPPAARWWRAASWAVGVVVSPMSITSQPTETSPAIAACANIGPEVRASRPSTTARDLLFPFLVSRFPSIAHTPNAAA